MSVIEQTLDAFSDQIANDKKDLEALRKLKVSLAFPGSACSLAVSLAHPNFPLRLFLCIPPFDPLLLVPSAECRPCGCSGQHPSHQELPRPPPEHDHNSRE